jgi:hypothetical protein
MFWEWIAATFSNWQAWLSGGGAGGACIVVIALVEQFTSWKMNSSWRIVLVFVFFVLGASFMTWKNERKLVVNQSEYIASLQKQVASLNQSEITGEIEFSILGKQFEGSQAGLIVSLHNNGAASSILPNSWKLVAVTADGLSHEGRPNTLKNENLDFCLAGTKVMRFVRPDALYLKAADRPVERNGYMQGFLLFGFPNLKRELLTAPETQLILTAQGVSGQMIKTEITIAGLLAMSAQPTKFFAGIENPKPIEMSCKD